MAEFDVVIQGGTVVDGTRTPRYAGDVGIKNGKIAKIERNGRLHPSVRGLVSGAEPHLLHLPGQRRLAVGQAVDLPVGHVRVSGRSDVSRHGGTRSVAAFD